MFLSQISFVLLSQSWLEEKQQAMKIKDKKYV